MLVGSFFFAWMGTAAYALRFACDWQVIALARSSLALIFAALLATTGGARLVLLSPGILWVRSIAGSVSLVCTFFALTRLPQSQVLTLTSTFPIWVALLSWPLYNERPTMQVWLSVVASVAGVALITYSREPQPPELLRQSELALVCALIASVATAIAMLGLHRLQYLHPWAIVVHFSGVAVLFCLGSFFFLGGHIPEAEQPLNSPTLLLLLAVGSTATIGQLFLTKAFAAGPPAKVSVVSLTQVVFAMLLDVLLWGHQFRALTLLGMGLIVTPTAWLMASRANED
jgi:drug/metabolite transporter (DMT)-like permease